MISLPEDLQPHSINYYATLPLHISNFQLTYLRCIFAISRLAEEMIRQADMMTFMWKFNKPDKEKSDFFSVKMLK